MKSAAEILGKWMDETLSGGSFASRDALAREFNGLGAYVRVRCADGSFIVVSEIAGNRMWAVADGFGSRSTGTVFPSRGLSIA